MIRVSELELYDALREKMDEKGARALVEYIEMQTENKFEQAKSIFSTKEDLLHLEMRITQLITDSESRTAVMFAETHKMIAESKLETQKMVSDSKSETQKMILEAKAENIKWMFVFILTSTISIIGVNLVISKMSG